MTLGGATIVTLHGLGLGSGYLRPWHDPLSPIYFEQRPDGDLECWGRDALARADKPIVFGHSNGAMLALDLALRAPDRIAGLILCGVAPSLGHLPAAAAAAHARDPVLAEMLVSGFANPPATDAELHALWTRVLPLYFHGPVRDIFAATAFSAAAFRRSMPIFSALDLSDRLAQIRVPTLVITGADDFIMPPERGRFVASQIPGAQYIELAHSGHFPFVEEPEAYRAAIAAWLA